MLAAREHGNVHRSDGFGAAARTVAGGAVAATVPADAKDRGERISVAVHEARVAAVANALGA